MRIFLLSFLAISSAFVQTVPRHAFQSTLSLRMANSDLVDVSGYKSAIDSMPEMDTPNTALLDNLSSMADDTIAKLDTVAATVAPTLNGLSMETVSLVLGQETYGLAIVCVGEALYSFLQLPSLDNAKVLVPAAVAAAVLVLVSGPLVTSGDVGSVGTGLTIATVVSVGLGASYIARMLAPYSPAPKEVAFLGLLVAVAGFFSFTQNLIVDGFVTLPSLPTLPSLELPSIQLPF